MKLILKLLFISVITTSNSWGLTVSQDGIGSNSENIILNSEFSRSYSLNISEDYLFLDYPKINPKEPCLNLPNCSVSGENLTLTKNYEISLISVFYTSVNISFSFVNDPENSFFSNVIKEGSTVINSKTLANGETFTLTLDLVMKIAGANITTNPKGFLIIESEVLP